MNVAVCCIVKNENKYLKEWVNHYINKGFSHIYLYDNNLIDDEDPIEVLGDSDFVTIDYRYRGKHDKKYQNDAYTLCYNMFNKLHDYILFCDADEFIEFDGFNTISEYINSNKNLKIFDSIELYWKIYTDNDKILYEDLPLQERFTEISKHQTFQVKSIIKCGIEKQIRITAHGCTSITHCNTRGEECNEFNLTCPHAYNKTQIYYGCYLKHYMCKTIDEFISVKLKNWDGTTLFNKYVNFDMFFKINKKTKEKIDFIKSHNYNYE